MTSKALDAPESVAAVTPLPASGTARGERLLYLVVPVLSVAAALAA